MIKGSKHTEESKLKLKLNHADVSGDKNPNFGKPRSEETKRKIGEANKGKTPNLGNHHSEETKKKIGEANLGRHHLEEAKVKIGLASKGRKHTEETKRKIGDAQLGENNAMFGKHLYGEDGPNWQGGITPEHYKIRNSDEYNNWRLEVYKRDYYTCQICGYKGKKLNAHHIKYFSKFPELRFEVSNGITLCADCHDTQGLHKGLRTAIAI